MRVGFGSRFSAPVVGAVLTAVVLAACSDSSKVGEGLEARGGTSTSACRLGECTTTTVAAAPGSTVAAPTTVRPTTTTTTMKPTPTTAPPKQAVFVIKLQADEAPGGAFSPRVSAVRLGTLVRWTNTDSVARSVEADEGRFRSPMIAPGASYDYPADAAGSFNYHDGTRPYAVGTLQVG